MGKLTGRIQTGAEIATNIILILTTLMIFSAVVTRFFGSSYDVVLEFGRWGHVWLVYLILGVLEKTRGHVSVDVLTRKFPERYQKGLLIFADGVTFIFAVALLISGIQLCQHLAEMQVISHTEVPTPLWIARICIPLGALLLAFFSFNNLYKGIRSAYQQMKGK